MTPEEIKAKSLELAAFYTAKANGKTLQLSTKTLGWTDVFDTDAPDLSSDLSRWRVKPEPRTFWVSINADGEVISATRHQSRADQWIKDGKSVIETVEVLP